MTAYMPDGRPAPYLMTSEELFAFLRMSPGDKDGALMRLRAHGLCGVPLGKRVRYPLPSVLTFLDQKLREYNR